MNRGGIADLPLLRTLLVVCQKSWEPSFWKVVDSFVLVAYASLAASRTLSQVLLACLISLSDKSLKTSSLADGLTKRTAPIVNEIE